MQYEIIGWTFYDDTDYAVIDDAEKEAYLTTTLIKEIRKRGYRFPGDRHAVEGGWVPVFNSGEKFCTSQRGWGAIMAQAWHEDNSDGMGYNAWHLTWGRPESEFVFPEFGVDNSRIVEGVELTYEPMLDEEYYMAGPGSPEQYEAMLRRVMDFVRETGMPVVTTEQLRKKE